MSMANELLLDAFQRIRESVHGVVDGLSVDQLAFRIDGRSNSIAWLVWHLTRIQDDHIADLAGRGQAWQTDGWAASFDLPFDPSDTGFGHSSEDVAAVRVKGDLLGRYHDAVHEQTAAYVAGLTDDDYARVIDEAWDPPVTLGVRLLSVVNDDIQHAGQAAFVRGYVEGGD